MYLLKTSAVNIGASEKLAGICWRMPLPLVCAFCKTASTLRPVAFHSALSAAGLGEVVDPLGRDGLRGHDLVRPPEEPDEARRDARTWGTRFSSWFALHSYNADSHPNCAIEVTIQHKIFKA